MCEPGEPIDELRVTFPDDVSPSPCTHDNLSP